MAVVLVIDNLSIPKQLYTHVRKQATIDGQEKWLIAFMDDSSELARCSLHGVTSQEPAISF